MIALAVAGLGGWGEGGGGRGGGLIMSKTGKMKMWGRTQIVEKNMIFFFFLFFFA